VPPTAGLAILYAMTRRFELGPILLGVGALVLLVSLFLDWYGAASAWDAFEVVDVLLGVLALLALLAAVGLIAPELGYMDRRWLPVLVLGVLVLVVAEIISRPPSVGDADPQDGAWVALGAAVLMLAGGLLSLGRVSFAVAYEGREWRHRVSAVDQRQPTTETAAVVAPETARTTPMSGDGVEEPPPRTRRKA
jgi:hypothetical protein